MNRLFVVTGGPCTGKTTVINELMKDFKVMEEIARKVIAKTGYYNEEIQREILRRQILQLNEAKEHPGIVFFDRSVGDSLGYMKINNWIKQEDIDRCKPENTGYEIIFFLDFVPYKKDSIRKESKEEAEKIHDNIYHAYNELGYKIVKIPLLSVNERINLIKKSIF